MLGAEGADGEKNPFLDSTAKRSESPIFTGFLSEKTCVIGEICGFAVEFYRSSKLNTLHDNQLGE